MLRSVDDKANTVALEKAATKWAADLTPSVSALALTFVVFACAEPQTAVQLPSGSSRHSKRRPRHESNRVRGFLLLKAVVSPTLSASCSPVSDSTKKRFAGSMTAVDLAETAQDEDTRDRFRGNLAHSLETLGRIDEARSVLSIGARRLPETRGTRALLAFGLSGLAAHLIRQLHLDEARALAEEAIAVGHEGGGRALPRDRVEPPRPDCEAQGRLSDRVEVAHGSRGALSPDWATTRPSPPPRATAEKCSPRLAGLTRPSVFRRLSCGWTNGLTVATTKPRTFSVAARLRRVAGRPRRRGELVYQSARSLSARSKIH